MSTIHFKYYKTCLMNDSITCKIDKNSITLRVRECSDLESIVHFVLKKQELEVNNMIEVMMKEIKEMKKMLWFSNRELNKFSENYVSNWHRVFNSASNVVRTNKSWLEFEFFYQEMTKVLLKESSTHSFKQIVSKIDAFWEELNYEEKEHYLVTPCVKWDTDIVNITGIGNNGVYDESYLEPVVIYFKQKVEFSQIDILVKEGDKKDETIKIYIYGVMKPQGVIRSSNSFPFQSSSTTGCFFQYLPG